MSQTMYNTVFSILMCGFDGGRWVLASFCMVVVAAFSGGLLFTANDKYDCKEKPGTSSNAANAKKDVNSTFSSISITIIINVKTDSSISVSQCQSGGQNNQSTRVRFTALLSRISWAMTTSNRPVTTKIQTVGVNTRAILT